jgi:hypothetical protein
VPGRINIPVAARNATVETVALDGRTVTPASRSDGGGFFTVGTGLTADYRVLAHLDGGPTLSLEVRGGGRAWLWIDGITTMISRYMRTHPGVPLEDATDRVKRYLGIPSYVQPGSGLGDTRRSSFSWSAFVAAAGSTPLDQFLDQQVARVDTGQTIPFRKPDPYPAIDAVLSGVPVVSARRSSAIAQADGHTLSDFLFGVGTGVVGNLITGVVQWGVGYSTEKCVLNTASADVTDLENDLQAIDNELTALDTELSALQTALDTDFNSLASGTRALAAYQSLSQARLALEPVLSNLEYMNGLYVHMLKDIQVIPQPSGPNYTPPASVQQFAATLHQYMITGLNGSTLTHDVQTLHDYLLGEGLIQEEECPSGHREGGSCALVCLQESGCWQKGGWQQGGDKAQSLVVLCPHSSPLA